MIAIQKFDMYLDRPEKKLRVCGVQGDALSRAVCFRMYQSNRAWKIPEGTRVAVCYEKEDRTGGIYDALPDGTPAWQAAGNSLTVFLAPQMFTAAGKVQAQLELKNGDAVLRSFAFTLEVSRSLPVAEGSRDYFREQYAFLPQTDSAEVGQALQITGVNDQGWVTRVSGVEIQELGEDGATFYPAVSERGDLSWTNDRGLENPATVNLMGPAGKTAYQYAQEAGYTGTEADFAEKLASESNLVTDERINELIDAKLAEIPTLASAEGVGF